MWIACQKSQPKKTAIVVMVKNGEDYLPEFLFHHLPLVDDIFLIDHSSKRDLRGLSLDRVHVFRSNHRAQYQSECTNLVIEHCKIREKFGWLFVLDIDEFLPFYSRQDINRYLALHSRKKAIRFHWLNGVPFDRNAHSSERGLSNRDEIRFYDRPSHGYKTFVNIRATRGRFWVPTGAHHVGRRASFLEKLFRSKNHHRNYKPYVEKSLTLFHILATSKAHFVAKIANYVDQFQYRRHVMGQGGWHVENYDTNPTDEQFLWYVANFRVSDPNKWFEVTVDDFKRFDVFRNLKAVEIESLRTKIFSLPAALCDVPPLLEDEYREQKTDDNAIADNLSWFMVNNDAEIINKKPK